MRKIFTIAAMLLAVIFTRADAQERQVTGKVTSSDGGTLPGVTVIVKGTTIGTNTDLDGVYKISVPAEAKTLKFLMVGMKTKEVEIGTSATIDVVLETDVLRLDEVVVTALGISREKKSLGYATQGVTAEQLNTSGSGNALSELSGKVSGLTVINSSGDPGSGTYMQLRGVTSLTGSNQPLMVIDGMPIDNSINTFDPTNIGTFGLGGAASDNRGIDVNPNDIESITVLKGPAATALYGIQAASGAIIITTKKGHAGGQKGISVELNSSASIDKYNKLPDLQNTFAQGNNGKYYSPTSSGSNKKFSWGPNVDSLYWDGNSNVWDTHGNVVGKSNSLAKIPVTPYDRYAFFQTGNTFNNSLAVSGSNDKSGYRMSIGNMSQTGIIPLTGYYKNTVSLSGQSNISNKMSITGTVTYIKSSQDKAQQGSNTSGVMLGLLRTPNTFDNAYSNADAANVTSSYLLDNPLSSGWNQRNYRGGPGYDNPYWTVNMNPFHQDLDRVMGSMQADYKLYDWMTLTYRLGGDVYTQNQKNAYNINSDAGIQSSGAGGIFLNDYYNSIYNSDFIINMKKRLSKDFSGSLVLGQNYYTSYYSSHLMAGYSFAIPTFFDLSNAESYQTSENEVRIRRSAWYGEANLGYKDQVYLTVTGRDETTSTLAANNNNFFYPSANLSWVFTEPLGLSSNKTFPYGKLRISYAGVGKDAPAQGLATYYRSAAVNDGFTGGVSFPFNGLPAYNISSTTSVIGNPNLVPEHTNSFELGFDLTFLQNRVSFNATYYNEKSTNVIFTVPTSYATGYASALLNAATITNHGFELSLNTTPVKLKNSFTWDLNFNWSKNTNNVETLYSGVQNLFINGFTGGAIYAVEGQPFGVIYGTQYQRVNPSDNSSALLINDDKTSSGYGMPIGSSQTGSLGNIQPKWIGSMVNNFTFKGFTLGIQIDVRHGGQIWNGTKGALDYFGTGAATANRNTSTTFTGIMGHLNAAGQVVHYDGTGNEIAGAGSSSTPSVILNEYYWQNIGSSFVGPTEPDVQDGSYIKLRQLSLSYQFPKTYVQKLHLQKLSLTFFMNNIILQTKYTGVDPETSLVGASNGQGMDYFNNPGIKSYGLRLNVGI